MAADGRVTFRLRAPNAREVFVTGFGARLAMQKNEQGVWTATSDALKPDIYTYSFNVDGTTFNDPANPNVKTSFGNAGTSLFRVPGSNPWDPADVPRGAITQHFYKSAVIGDRPRLLRLHAAQLRSRTRASRTRCSTSFTGSPTTRTGGSRSARPT